MNKIVLLLGLLICSAAAQATGEMALDTNSMTPMQKKYYYEELNALREAQPVLNEPVKTESVIPQLNAQATVADSQKTVSSEPLVQKVFVDTAKFVTPEATQGNAQVAKPALDSVPVKIVAKPKNDLEDLENLAEKSSLAVRDAAERQRKAREAALAANPPKSNTGLIIGSIAAVAGAGALVYAVLLDGQVDKLNEEYQGQLDPFQFSTQKSNIEQKASTRDLVGGVGLGLLVGGITVAIAF